MTEINKNKCEVPSGQQRILITGVSGLMGRILFNYLTEKYPTKYQVFGIDQHLNISTRYQSINIDNIKIKSISSISTDKFFQCDITDRTKLHQIIQEQKIEIIIHLAALLENYTDIDKISHVNIDGTKNIFEAAGIHRIIYASSVMTVFGYITQEPYLSIFHDTFDDATMLESLQKITIKDYPPLADIQSPGCTAYSQSKIIGEQMATDIVKNSSKSIICARFGSINIDDQPGKTWLRHVWCSYRDLCSFIDKALEAPQYISGIYFIMSNNYRLWVDLDDAKQDLGFVPQDGAEKL